MHTGCKHVLCFEINEDSVEALKKNIQQNGVQEKCEVSEKCEVLYNRSFWVIIV